MNPRLFATVLLYLFLISGGSTVAIGQATELPSAPTAKSAQPVVLPQGTPRVVAESKQDAPPAPVDDEFCYAPAEGLYAPQPKDPPAVWEAQARYTFAIHDQLESSWRRHMPWKANDFWIKGKIVVVRFAIMPDGSIDTPVVTLTSGRKDYDKGAMDAVMKAAPFPPLPAGTSRPQQVCMRFGYFADPRPKEDPKPDPLYPAPAPKP